MQNSNVAQFDKYGVWSKSFETFPWKVFLLYLRTDVQLPESLSSTIWGLYCDGMPWLCSAFAHWFVRPHVVFIAQSSRWCPIKGKLKVWRAELAHRWCVCVYFGPSFGTVLFSNKHLAKILCCKIQADHPSSESNKRQNISPTPFAFSNSDRLLWPTLFTPRSPTFFFSKQEVLGHFLFLCSFSSILSSPILIQGCELASFQLILTYWPARLAVDGWTVSSSLVLSHGYIHTYSHVHGDMHIHTRLTLYYHKVHCVTVLNLFHSVKMAILQSEFYLEEVSVKSGK